MHSRTICTPRAVYADTKPAGEGTALKATLFATPDVEFRSTIQPSPGEAPWAHVLCTESYLSR